MEQKWRFSLVIVYRICQEFLILENRVRSCGNNEGIHLQRCLMPAAERFALQLPPRRAAPDHFKKATISRAEGGQLQAPVRPAGPSYFLRFPCDHRAGFAAGV